MTFRRLAFAVVGLAVLIPSMAPAQDGLPAGVNRITSVEGITEYRLENGLRLLLFPDASRPTVTVAMTVFVGSRHEGYGETGMAHLLEHMLFKGTPTHHDIPKALKERGAQFNGSTSSDRTNYFETLPASDENLEFAIRLEADIVSLNHRSGHCSAKVDAVGGCADDVSRAGCRTADSRVRHVRGHGFC